MLRAARRMLPAVATGALLPLVVAPAASAASTSGAIEPLGLFGLPSLHSIIEGIAKGFFGALANALVPGWLKHGTVATIQHLVALPDPASWTHVGQLQGDMVYLGVMLLPVTLAVSTVRYWLVGFTGAAHPAGALGRCVWVTFVLVAYRWFVEQAVAAHEHPHPRDPRLPHGRKRPAAHHRRSVRRCAADGRRGSLRRLPGHHRRAVRGGPVRVAGPPHRPAGPVDRGGPAADRALGDSRALAPGTHMGARADGDRARPAGLDGAIRDCRGAVPRRHELHRRRRRTAGPCRGGVRRADHVRDRGEAATDAARRAAAHAGRRKSLGSWWRRGVGAEHDAGRRASQGRSCAAAQRHV